MPYVPAAAARLRSLTTEQRSRQPRGRRRPLEAQLDDRNRQSWLENSRRGGRRIADLWAAGVRVRPQPKAASWKYARARWLEPLEDPAYRARYSAKLIAGRNARADINCSNCSATFSVPKHITRGDHNRFCSRDCLRRFQQERGLQVGRELATRSRQLKKSYLECGTSFTGTGKQKYCSSPCNVRAKSHRATADCGRCGVLFNGRGGQRYCSRHCAAQAARAWHAHDR